MGVIFFVCELLCVAAGVVFVKVVGSFVIMVIVCVAYCKDEGDVWCVR